MLSWLFSDDYKKKKEQERIASEEARKDTKTNPTNSRNNTWFSNSSHSISISNDVVIVNGKRLQPGTPEYKRAKAAAARGLEAGMKGLDAGMKALDKAMENMDDMFKDML